MKIITKVELAPEEIDLLMNVLNFTSHSMNEVTNKNTNIADSLDWLFQGAAYLLNQNDEGTKRYEEVYGAY